MKNKIIKKVFIAIAIILGFLGLDHFTYNWVSGGGAITVTDSSIVITPIHTDTTTHRIAVNDSAPQKHGK